jgi:GAF domain-containing protein
MTFPKPANESRRLKVLWQYDVLDSVPEAMFDDLTELAAAICAAPIAMVSLVDENRQWFKSVQGISQRETSRDISFCAHAICQSDLFIVSDTRRDPRFSTNPLVRHPPKIRFYAGSPLITPDGYALGTLCVLDKRPRRLNAFQKRALQLLSRVVLTQLELRRHSRVPVNVGKPKRRHRGGAKPGTSHLRIIRRSGARDG